MKIEDRIRAATRARGDLVREIRPLDLPVIPGRRLPVLRRSMMWLAPVAAVVMVAALAITMVSIRQLRQAPAAHHHEPTFARDELPKTPPRYYVALDDPVGTAYSDPRHRQPKGQVNLVAGDARTGKTFASFRPRQGFTYVGVTGAADDRTFVVAAASFPLPDAHTSAAADAWFLLRIAPGTAHPATMTALSLPAPGFVDGMSLSPDGRELAVLAQADREETMTVYSVPTGQPLRTWSAPGTGMDAFGMGYWGRISNNSVSWQANGHELLFDFGSFGGVNGPLGGGAGGVLSGHMSVRELDLARPGNDLLTDSRKMFSPHEWCDTLQLSADGTTALCGMNSPPTSVKTTASDPQILAFSMATGRSHVVYRLKNGRWVLGVADVLWASPDGSTLIGAMNERSEVDGVGADYGYRVIGVIRNGRLSPFTVPLHDGVPVVGMIAF